ncbi:amidohydrolase 2 [Hymenopellis radicata]|nr:amidohydrolase 2 [Hymenopellis radicata]
MSGHKIDALKKSGHVPGPDGLPFTPERTQDWTPEDHLAFMERNNVSKSILSCTGPGTHLIPGDDAFGREVTREVNEFAADLKRRFPIKFGFFASLPLPDIDGALLEIDYALDQLDADGFVLMSNFHGMYLGDARLAPVYAKLQARKATVFVHPTTPCNSQACNHSDLTPQRKRDSIPLSETYIIGIMEYFFDSARTFVDILLSGTAAAHPDVTFIVPHCGNALPSVLDRALLTSSPELRHFQTRPMHALTAPVVKEMFAKQFYFDLSGNPMSNQIHHMLRWINSDRFLYGSDVPFTSSTAAETLAQIMESELSKLFGEQEIQDIYHGNAERLFASKQT